MFLITFWAWLQLIDFLGVPPLIGSIGIAVTYIAFWFLQVYRTPGAIDHILGLVTHSHLGSQLVIAVTHTANFNFNFAIQF